MRFKDYLIKKFKQKRQHETLLEQAREGERLAQMVDNGDFQLLLDSVLDPMYQEAFNSFIRINPENFSEVCQAQRVGWVVQEIKKRVEHKIALGRTARKQIVELAQEA